MANRLRISILLLAALSTAAGCGGPLSDGDADVDGDVDADNDGDGDADADVDGDGDGDSGLEPGECRSDDDCTEASETCVQPGAWTPCGIPCNAPRECEPADGCEGDLVCEEHVGDCCGPGEPLASRCVEPCTEGSCAEGERCPETGLCEPIPCAEGYGCPTHTDCTGGDRADEHGCVRALCAVDDDCTPAGFCVVGACYETPGTCQGPGA
jgi:predicted small lipoprotein YifL